MTDKLLGGKMMDAIQYGGKTYIHEPDVRAAVNAALATNGERNARIAELEQTLTVILPMAKGYAAEHQVGRNAEMVAEAEAVLRGPEGEGLPE